MKKKFFLTLGLSFFFTLISMTTVFADNVEVKTFDELKSAIEFKNTSVTDNSTVKERTIRIMNNIDIVDTLKIMPGTNVHITNGIDKITLNLGMTNSETSIIGKTIFQVEKGAKLSIEGTSNDAFIIDGGHKQNIISKKGDVLTVHGESVIKGLTIQNFTSTGTSKAPIYVDGGNLIINDIHIKDNINRYSETTATAPNSFTRNNSLSGFINTSAMGVTGKGTITMNNGLIENNSLPKEHQSKDFVFMFGTVTANNGTFIMNGGTIRNNTSHYGGAVGCIIHGTFIMNGGLISNNNAISYAGGLLVDWASKAELNGGTFEGNHTDGNGGAVVLNDRYREAENDEGGSKRSALAEHFNLNYAAWKPYYSYLTINGTEFKNNRAGVAGGALFLNGTNTKIEKALFESNKSTRFGGAIYLSSIPYILQMNNVLIENNNTDNSDIDRMVSYVGTKINMPQNAGGAIWYCPTGDSLTYVSNGGAFFDNKAMHDGDEIAALPRLVVSKDEKDPDKIGREYNIHVDARILGGSIGEWYKDGDNKGSTPRADLVNGTTMTMPIDAKDGISLKLKSNDTAKNLARSLATVVFRNNTSSRGGAIATNGTVIIGDKDRDFNISVSKVWKDGTEPADLVKIALYNVTDSSKEYLLEEAELKAANNWTYEFKNLPLEAGGKKIKYKVAEVENDNYLVDIAATGNGAEVGEDKTFAIVDTSKLEYTNLNNHEGYVQPSVVFTNEIKPVEVSSEASVEESTEVSSEASVEESTEVSSEASVEESTEVSSEASVEESTEVSSEASVEKSTNVSITTSVPTKNTPVTGDKFIVYSILAIGLSVILMIGLKYKNSKNID